MSIRSVRRLPVRRHAAAHPAWRWLRVVSVLGLWSASAVAGEPVAEGRATVQDLKFAAFFRQPVGPRGLEPSDTLRSAHGRPVRIVGYMVAQEQPPAGRFMLTPRPVRMSEHADGDADDLPPATVLVQLPPDQRGRIVRHRDGLIEVEGRLTVGRAEDDTGRVTWVQLQLDPGLPPAVPSKPPTSPENLHRVDP